MDLERLIYQILAGLVAGSLYGGLGLALAVAHRATGHINFAQGEMATLGTFIAIAVLAQFNSYPLAIVLACVASFLIGAAIEVGLISKLDGKSPLRAVVATIGLFMFLNGSAGFLFGYSARAVESPFVKLPIGGAYLSAHQIGSLATIVVLVVALFIIFRFTALGLAMRASAVNPQSAKFVGINVDFVRAVSWGVSAVIGTCVGLLVAPVVFLEPNFMVGVLVYAIAGALLGGIDSPFGAVLGGVLVGVLENLFGAYVVGTELKLTVALMIIIVVLVIRPQGLLGKRVQKRV